MKCHRGTYNLSEPLVSPAVQYFRYGLLLGFCAGLVTALAVIALTALFILR